MTKLLLRLFVKNYENSEDMAVRASVGKLAGGMGIVCNGILFLGKLIAGILSGSVAIIADAVNNLSDASSSVVTLVGFRLAQMPADQDHPYGHARYEYLSGLMVAVMILHPSRMHHHRQWNRNHSLHHQKYLTVQKILWLCHL